MLREARTAEGVTETRWKTDIAGQHCSAMSMAWVHPGIVGAKRKMGTGKENKTYKLRLNALVVRPKM